MSNQQYYLVVARNEREEPVMVGHVKASSASMAEGATQLRLAKTNTVYRTITVTKEER